MYENELFHHGVKGQHWGVRRYQNEDGSLTSAGRKISYQKKANKYQSKADMHKSFADDLDPKNATYKMSDSQKYKLNSSYNKQLSKASYNQEKANKYQKLSDAYRGANINDIIYSPGTRKAAAKYVVNKNMSIDEASTKAKQKAWGTTAAVAALAVVGTHALRK